MLAMLKNLEPSRYTHRTYIVSSGDDFSSTQAQAFENTLPVSTRSKDAAASFAVERTAAGTNGGDYTIDIVPRARKIHQSLLTTPFSCLLTLLSCLRILLFHPQGFPDLILTNGPATSVIVVLAVVILKYFSFLSSTSSFTPRNVAGLGEPGGRQKWSDSTVRSDGAAGTVEELGTVRQKMKRQYGGCMRRIHIESWARTRTPSLTLRIVRWGRLCDRVLVHWKNLEEEGWGEWKGDLIL